MADLGERTHYLPSSGSGIADSVFRKPIVGIAIKPALTRFSGCDHWVTARIRVPGGVSVRRVVAAERPAALLTRAQVNPTVARFYALFAFALLCMLDRGDRIQMGAASVGHD